MQAFFRPEGELFLAGELTRGPWSDALMHGGPPAALLGGALARAEPEPERFLLTRITVELLRPLAIGPLRVETALGRAGRQVQRLSARLLNAEGTELATASAVRVRRAALELPPRPAAPALPGPETAPPFEFPFFRPDLVAYHRAVETRIVRGAWGQGPLLAWMRPLVPLVLGRPTSALERLLIVADAESGVCPPLDPRQWAFPNPDLTVYLERDPQGEWFGLDAVASAQPGGVGLVTSALHDRVGPFGRAVQGLVVDRRES